MRKTNFFLALQNNYVRRILTLDLMSLLFLFFSPLMNCEHLDWGTEDIKASTV